LPTEFNETVNSLADEELILYREIAALVDQEEEKINASDLEGLLEVLRIKQAVISRQEVLLERWNEVSAELGITGGREEPLFWSALGARIGEQGYNQLVHRIEEIRGLGQNLLDREKQIRQTLEEHIAELRKTLVKLGKNRTALRGYSQSMGSSY